MLARRDPWQLEATRAADMTTIAEALAVALRHHQEGNWQQAEQLYRQVLQADPGHAEAWHLLGVLASQVGRPDLAVDYHRQALRLVPDAAAYHFDLAVAYRSLGRRPDAIASYQAALRLQPENAAAHNNLANALREEGRPQEAVAHYQEALRLLPHYAEAYSNLGNAYRDLARLDDAAASYRRAVELKPEYAAGHSNLGVALADLGRYDEAAASHRQALQLNPDDHAAHNNLAYALIHQGRPAEAVVHCRHALRIKPDYAGAYNNLGNALKDLGKPGEAAENFRQAIRLQPDDATGYNNLGVALVGLEQPAEAAENFRQAIRLQPTAATGYTNLAVVLTDVGQWDEAMARYDEALRVQPEDAEAHWNRALLLLLTGNLTEGWSENEWRRHRKEYPRRDFTQPAWDGAPLDGRTILLYAEQGLGDTLQFVRYAAAVRSRVGRVLVECQPALLPLLQRCPGIDQVVASDGTLPSFDVHASILSLPGILGTTLATIPADIPYLFAEESLIERWRGELGRLADGLRVGIVWQGSLAHRGDRRRSVPLERFEPLARLEHIQLLSLQVGTGVEQLATVGQRLGVIDVGSRFDPTSLADAAAVLRCLDLVVTVDTAIAHLAGALGVPVWVAIAFSPDWRWLLGRDDSPWYPTLRLFRQRQPGEWPEVFQRIADTLRDRALLHKQDEGGAGR
jgi:tetratricopeptide (TPR) repeat protein